MNTPSRKTIIHAFCVKLTTGTSAWRTFMNP